MIFLISASAAARPLKDALARRVLAAPGYAYFVGSAIFHYLGPSFAVLLFTRVPPLGVAWLRILTAALVYAIWRQPWRRWHALTPSGSQLVVAMGTVLAVMNACFYLAINRLPLATVAAIEFLPVIGLAALAARSARNATALAGAVSGVFLLTDARLAGAPVGFLFAFLNAALFALYIVLAHRVSRLPAAGGIDGLAAAMLIAAAVVTPIGGWAAVPAFTSPLALAAGIGVGVTSSVIPYVCDQLAMAKLARATYALFIALLPATATIIGIIVLAQMPSPVELLAITLVITAVALHREPRT